jgi:hypothetical protein
MIKEALEFLAKIQTPKNPLFVELHSGTPFAVKPDGTIGEYIRKPNPQIEKPTLEASSLNALVGAYQANLDGLDHAKVLVDIVGPFQVQIVDLTADDFGNRHVYLDAEHTPETFFKFAEYLLPEDFLIKFRSSFYFNEEAVKVQKLCSTVESGSAVAIADDGMSQQVTVTSGTITKAPVTLPVEGVPLIPWRTFREVPPVESRFLLRMKGAKDQMPRIALFEIDDKWKLDTVEAIRKYLTAKIPGAKIIG